jgi:hypothetical protein
VAAGARREAGIERSVLLSQVAGARAARTRISQNIGHAMLRRLSSVYIIIILLAGRGA